MKLAYITSGIFPIVVGGMQVVSRKHITGLAELGMDLVVAHSFRRSPKNDTGLPGHVHAVDWPYSRGLARWSPWHYVTELKKYSRQVHRLIEAEAPDVVYAEGPLVYHTLCQPTRCPLVFHPHGLNMFQDQKSRIANARAKILRPLVAMHCRRANCVITQGGLLTDVLESQIGVDPHRIVQIPNSVPAVTAGTLRQRRAPLRCLFVGRNDPKKGLKVLLQAIRATKGVCLDIVGMSGPNDHPSIHWHGVVRERSRMMQFYQENDLLILPSYSEGLATVLLEAMSCGMPAIATDVGASREVVIPGKTGWLVSPGNSDSLRSALVDAARMTDQQFQQISRNCIAHIEAGYLDTEACSRLYRVLDQLHNGRGTAPTSRHAA